MESIETNEVVHGPIKREVCIMYLDDMAGKRMSIDRISDRLREHIERMDMLRASSCSDIPGSTFRETDAILKMIVRMQEIVDELADADALMSSDLYECERICASGSTGLYILWLTKVKGMSMRKVSERLGISRSSAYNMAEGAYDELYDLIPLSWRMANL